MVLVLTGESAVHLALVLVAMVLSIATDGGRLLQTCCQLLPGAAGEMMHDVGAEHSLLGRRRVLLSWQVRSHQWRRCLAFPWSH